MIRITLLLIAAISCSSSAQAPPQSLSPCELVAKRTEYNGRIVAVRGVVAAGGHGIYLVSPNNCSYELVTRGIVWPNIINLVFPNNTARDISLHAPFVLDRKAIEAADDMLIKSGYRAGVDGELATYEGLFVTYTDLDKRVSPGVPGAFRLGFGPAGLGAPAQLVIKTIKDVTVIPGAAAHQ
jgi:hypothetical protein